MVPAVRVTRDTLRNDIRLVAEFQPYQEIDVMAKVAGYVSKLNVDMGSRVQSGAVLAVLEVPEMLDDLTRNRASIQRASADVERARDELRRTQATQEMAKLNFDRLSNVLKTKPGLIAQQEIDTARTRLLEADAQVSAAKSSLNAMEQAVEVNRAEQSRSQTLLNYTRVVAPFSGVVTKRYATVGAMIQAGTSSATSVMPVVRIAQDSPLRLSLPVPESAVPLIRTGFPVTIEIPTLKRRLEAKVSRFSSQLQLSTRTMMAEVDVMNPDFVIKPGMFAEVTFHLFEKPDVLSAPLGAFDGLGKDRTVMRIASSGLVETVKVAAGLETAEKLEILGGLQEGDLLVASGRSRLRAGERVSPKLEAR